MVQLNFQKIAAFSLGIFALLSLSRLLLPVLAPFLLAILPALAAEPLVCRLQKILHMKRGAAAGIGVSLALLTAVVLLAVCCALLLRGLGALAGVIPDLAGTVRDGIRALEGWLLSLAQRSPGSLRPVLMQGVEGIFSDGSAVLKRVSDEVLSMASGILKALPDSALGIGTWVLASFMLSARLPVIRAWCKNRLSTRWSPYLPRLRQLKTAVGSWLKAQLKLTGITFCILCLGFFLLKIRYWPLWAVLVALVDALPVLGTGTVLVPWGIVCFLQGQQFQGFGLLGIYLADQLLRSGLEPKLVGKQLGLDPLLTLVFMYAGYRFWGIGGMIFSPLLAVIAVQLFGRHAGPLSSENS